MKETYGYFIYDKKTCYRNYEDNFVNDVKSEKVVTIDDGVVKYSIIRQGLGKNDKRVGYNSFMKDSLSHREQVYFSPFRNQLDKDDVCFHRLFFNE